MSFVRAALPIALALTCVAADAAAQRLAAEAPGRLAIDTAIERQLNPRVLDPTLGRRAPQLDRPSPSSEEVLSGLSLKAPYIYVNPGLEPAPRAFGPAASPRFPNWGSDPRNQMPGAPGPGGDVVIELARQLELGCKGSAVGGCANVGALDAVGADLKTADRTHSDCTAAARDYARDYLPGPVSPAVARNYDLSCLAASEPRTGAPASPLPAELTAAGAGRGAALTAIAILESPEGPFCGALLRNDRTIVTAQHCFKGKGGAYLRLGRVLVRPIDGRHAPWPLARAVLKQGGPSTRVTDDWAVVAIETTDAIGAAALPLSSAVLPGRAFVVGYFRGHLATPPGPGGSAEPWKHGIRWSKPGLCQVIDPRTGCIRMICQTVQGFSGAPVLANRASDRALVVAGFISAAAAQDDSSCGASVGFVTLAVAADGVTG